MRYQVIYHARGHEYQHVFIGASGPGEIESTLVNEVDAAVQIDSITKIKNDEEFDCPEDVQTRIGQLTVCS